MSRKVQIAVVAVVLVGIVAALGVYAWDSTRSDRIAEGITIAGIDVGGLTTDEARAEIESNVVAPLNKPVVVEHGDEKFILNKHESDITADTDGMVDEALAASREGNFVSRTWRSITGGEVDATIRPEIKYDKDALDHFIAHIEGNVDQEPVDASVDPSGGVLEPVASQPGVKVDDGQLRAEVERALHDPSSRTVKAEVEKIKPDVTTSQVADKYPTYLVVDRSNFTLTLYRNLKEEKQYTVAIGAQGFDTPTGLYHIQDKQENPVWSVPDSAWAGDLAGQTIPPGPDNPIKARWMGIFDGAGIHGTTDTGSLGSAASHGCVRMAIPDVIDLYDRVDVGTPIYIG